MSQLWQKIGLLLWKNMKVLQRHWIMGIFEILIPLALFVLISWINSIGVGRSEQNVVKEPTYFHQVSVRNLQFPRDSVQLFYSPENNFTTDLIKKVQRKLKFNNKRIKPFPSEKDMENYMSVNYDTLSVLGEDAFGIIFNNMEDSSSPKNLNYKIRHASVRWKTDKLFPIYKSSGPMSSPEIYFDSGFMALQHAIDTAFTNTLQLKNPRVVIINQTLQQFPYPPYVVDSGSSLINGKVVALCSIFAFFILFLNIVGRIVEDKYTGVTELMKLMGLTRWMLWLTWTIRIVLDSVVIVTIMVFFLKISLDDDVGAIFKEANPFLIWVFLFLFGLSVATFIFIMSSVFSRPTLAVSFGSVIWLMSYFIPVFAMSKKSTLYGKLGMCLFPNVAMYFGFQIIHTYELRYVGASWNNLYKSPTGSPDDVKMGHVLFMLCVDILIYALVAFYIDAIKPGKFGVPESPFFCFTRSFWGLQDTDRLRTSESLLDDRDSKFEAPPQGLAVGIKIDKLRKKYSSGKVAVDGVTLDIYEGQITALLGHNGAGKTTTMSIITGMLPSTSGSVWINNYNIRTDLAKVRQSLGLCPQHNMLFSDLTVIEHLMFFGQLKGLSATNAKKEGKSLLKSMKLDEKAHHQASHLSGGMKRKLSLGIALIGGSKVVILDEPTSGLDPQSRRQIWDMLLGMRGHRTIVITTHFMEEADVLGDRIAIMDHGRVQCYGTSLYLKKQYGAGYVLKLLIQEFCDISRITSIVKGAVPGAKLKCRLGSELSYSLPAEKTSTFPSLFNELELDKIALGVSSIGVSLTTLEDVFLNVGNQAAADGNAAAMKSTSPVTSPTPSSPHSTSPGDLTTESREYSRPKATGLSLLCMQIEAMIIKKMIVTGRKWFTFLILAVVAVLLTFAAFERGLSAMTSVDSASSGLQLSLNKYGPTEVYYSDVQIPAADWYKGFISSSTDSVAVGISPQLGLSDALLREGKADISKYRNDFIVAAEFNGSASNVQVDALFSGISYHSAPISLNLVNNALLKSVMASNEYSITVENHPFSLDKESSQEYAGAFVGFIWQSLMPIGLLFFMANFLVFPVLERVSNAKQLQYMTGVSPLTYWLSCFAWDLLVYMIVATCMVAMMPAIDWSGQYGGSKEIAIFALILFAYGVGCIPYVYWYSYFIDTASSAFALFVGVNFVIGSILPWVIVITETATIADESPEGFDVVTAIKNCCYLLPQFSLSIILMDFAEQAVTNNLCASIGADYKKDMCAASPANPCCKADAGSTSYIIGMDTADNPFGVGVPLLMLAVDALLYFGIILLLDYGIVSQLTEKVKKRFWPVHDDQDEVDADVQTEVDRVQTSEGNVLTVNNMMKAYNRKAFAVKGVSFGVVPGECFGLLGINGAGKTTTFKMLTGAEIPTQGDARIDHYTLDKYKAKYLSQIGYCPQFDAINESLTGRETLQLFASLRGIHKVDAKAVVQKWLKVMGLEEYQDALSGTYSGGNKRKLSTAMALIGEPPLIFLDEPTSGVDPVARRNLWSVLAKIQTRNRSIVLTSHSMEECEALCNRLAIMVRGHFVCIGETQHLKQKFGQGFTVVIKLKDVEEQDDKSENVMKLFRETFPSCVLKDKHTGLLHYHLTDPNIAWRTLFSQMETMKAENTAIEDYTVSETTLEQVFLSFAQK